MRNYQIVVLIFVFIFIPVPTLFSQTPSILPGYPLVLDSNENTYNSGASPIIADFNGDGNNEILVCVNLDTYTGWVHLLNSDGSSMPGFPKKVTCNLSYMTSAAGDVNGDGFIDLVIKADSVYVFDYHGNILNGFPVFFPNTTSDLLDKLAIYDLDNNGNLEIIVGRYRTITVYNSDGQIRNGWPHILDPTFISFPSIGDLNNDNIPEIIFPASEFNTALQIYDSSKIFIFEPDGQFYSNPIDASDSNYFFFFNPAVIFKNKQKDSTFFVVNSNSSPEGIPNTFKSRVTIYNAAGNMVKRFNLTPRYGTDQISMGDVNGDSDPDIVFGSDFNEVFAYNLDGDLIPGYPVFADNYQFRSSSIGKISTDMCVMAMGGPQDTVVLNLSYLKAFNSLGIQLPWSPLRPLGIPVSAVTFGDVNNDKQVDFLFTTIGILIPGPNSGLYAWTMPGIIYERENFPWPMYCHDRYRTNQFGFTPPDEPVGIHPISSIVPDVFVLYQNFPNPFNPVTHIKFDIPQSTGVGRYNVRLIVYDVLGKEINTPLNEELNAGSYLIKFDGSNLSSGVYYYSLEMDNNRETRKFILLK